MTFQIHQKQFFNILFQCIFYVHPISVHLWENFSKNMLNLTMNLLEADNLKL